MNQNASNRLIAARNSGDTKGAIVAILDWLAIEPESGSAQTSLSLAYSEDGQLTRAEECARRALALEPDLWAAHVALSFSLRQQRRFLEAQQANNRALELEPENEAVLRNAVEVAQLLKDDATTEKMTERFLQSHPTSPAAHVAFGGLRYRNGQTGAARAAALRALEYDPEFANAHMLLALIDLQLQRREAARASVATVLRLNPQHALAQSVSRTLREPKIKIFSNLGASMSPRGLLLLAMVGLLLSGTIFTLLPLYFGAVDEKWLFIFICVLVFWPLARLESNLRKELPAREQIYLSDGY